MQNWAGQAGCTPGPRNLRINLRMFARSRRLGAKLKLPPLLIPAGRVRLVPRTEGVRVDPVDVLVDSRGLVRAPAAPPRLAQRVALRGRAPPERKDVDLVNLVAMGALPGATGVFRVCELVANKLRLT